MKLIVGLGNPGERYKNSRHNVGFLVVEALARKLLPAQRSVWKKSHRVACHVLRIPDKDLLLVKPQTMMNASGEAVKKIAAKYQISDMDIFVIHDDLDLPLGKIKIVKARGCAGHHGVESIIQSLGTTNFCRLRLGVGRPAKKGEWLVSSGSKVSENVKQREVTRFVLGGFSSKEKTELRKMIKKAVEILLYTLDYGAEAAMTHYHQ